MGYTTDFRGELEFDREVDEKHVAYINKFSNTRRMKRDAEKAALLPDPLREAVGLPIGEEGAFFVGGTGLRGQDSDDSVLDHNEPPGLPSYSHNEDYGEHLRKQATAIAANAQPGLWCQWVIADGVLQWDEGEKFYHYVEWLEYMIRNFFEPWGYKLNGTIQWRGEDWEDNGTIDVTDNEVEVS